MILGHLALAVATKRSVFRVQSFLLLSVAAFGPDLLDKPFKLLFHVRGRGFGHILLLPVVMALLAVLWRRLSPRSDFRASIAFLALWLSHLAGDFVKPAILFWPFLGPMPKEEYTPFLVNVVRFYTAQGDISMLVLEIVCVTLAAWLCLRSGPSD